MPLVVYSVLRVALIALALVVLRLAGLGGWLLVLVATVVALALSYVLLTRQRDAAAMWLAARAEQRRGEGPRLGRRAEADAAAEDAAADDAEAHDAEAHRAAGRPPDAQSARPRPSSTP